MRGEVRWWQIDVGRARNEVITFLSIATRIRLSATFFFPLLMCLGFLPLYLKVVSHMKWVFVGRKSKKGVINCSLIYFLDNLVGNKQ